jgi:predicted ATP-grasp superfamily ATP-dependent carboligase
VVLKADGSWGGDGVIVAKSRDEAFGAYRKLSRAPSRARSIARAARRRDAHHLLTALHPPTPAISIQEFIPGKPAASAFAAWQGEVVGEIYYDVLIADGAIGPPNVIRRIDDREIDRATRAIAKHFGLCGIHGIDFIRAPDGALYMLEVNPRATQGGTLAFGPGHDLPAALAACVSPTAGIRTAIENNVVAIFPREWQRDPVSPYLRSAHHDVPWDDPAVVRASLLSA